MNQFNEFSAKKLGEVLAFASLSLDTLNKARETLTETLGEDYVLQIESKNKNYIETINKITSENGVVEIVNKKLTGTGNKLKAMRDLYISDEWHNPTELLEWSGFFLGATIVHWQLVKGVAENLNNQTLKDLANDALNFHQALFDQSQKKLNQIGEEKSA